MLILEFVDDFLAVGEVLCGLTWGFEDSDLVGNAILTSFSPSLLAYLCILLFNKKLFSGLICLGILNVLSTMALGNVDSRCPSECG